MGVRLIVEILDHWQDVGLTPGERGDLIVLAENANDSSRETWGAVHAAHILKRAGKSAPSWRISINRLMKKKALEFALRDGKELRGYTGQHAVYRLVELCPEPPHSGYKGHCTKPEKGVDSVDSPPQEEGHPTDDPAQEEGYPSVNPVGEDPEEGYLPANPEGYLTANAVEGLGYLTATERVSCQLTPTPLVPSLDLSSKDSPSSSPAEAEPGVIDAELVEDGGGGGSLSMKEITEQCERVSAFVDSLDYRGRMPGKQQRLRLGQRVTVALKDGWSEKGLRRYLDISDDPNVRSAAALYLHRLGEDELPAPAPAASDPEAVPPACEACLEANPGAAYNLRLRVREGPDSAEACPDCHPGSASYRRAGGDGGMWDRAMGRAQARMASGDWRGAGTDERVGGWLALAGSLTEREAALNGPSRPSTADLRVAQGQALAAKFREQERAGGSYKPYSNSGWDEMEHQIENGLRPAGADTVRHCGDEDCDEYTRTRRSSDGLDDPRACGKCHPRLQF